MVASPKKKTPNFEHIDLRFIYCLIFKNLCDKHKFMSELIFFLSGLKEILILSRGEREERGRVKSRENSWARM